MYFVDSYDERESQYERPYSDTKQAVSQCQLPMPQSEPHLQTRLLRGIVLNRTEVNVEVGQFRFEVGRRVSGVYRGTTVSLNLICLLHVVLREFHGRYYRYSVTGARQPS